MTRDLDNEARSRSDGHSGDRSTDVSVNIEALKTKGLQFVAAIEDDNRERAERISRDLLLGVYGHIGSNLRATGLSTRSPLIKELQRRILLDARRLVLAASILGTEPRVLAAARELRDLIDFYGRRLKFATSADAVDPSA